MAEETKNISFETSDSVSEISDKDLASTVGGNMIESGSRSLLIYEWPTTRTNVIGGMVFGQKLKYGGETIYNGNKAQWRKVICNGQTGWVLAQKTVIWAE